MGVPIPTTKERQIKTLLKRRLGLRAIARKVGVKHDTVRRVRDKPVKRKNAKEGIPFEPIEPEVCHECSQRAGFQVLVRYRPCVACTCRRELASKRQAAS